MVAELDLNLCRQVRLVPEQAPKAGACVVRLLPLTAVELRPAGFQQVSRLYLSWTSNHCRQVQHPLGLGMNTEAAADQHRMSGSYLDGVWQHMRLLVRE